MGFPPSRLRLEQAAKVSAEAQGDFHKEGNFERGTIYGERIDVKCQLCEHIADCCAKIVIHVQKEHKRTSSLIPKLKKHYIQSCFAGDVFYESARVKCNER